MTPTEFKAWFDGFTEALDGVPSKDQWARIKKRVSEIDGRPVTERVYVDRYIEHYWPRLMRQAWEVPLQQFTVTCNTQGNSNNVLGAYQNAVVGVLQNETFESHQAMCALGRAEAAFLS